MSRFIAVAMIIVLCSLGCASEKMWVPTGGSRADGTVRLSYEFSSLESPRLNPQQGIDAASSRCKAWGYLSAEPFGGQQRTCTSHDQFGSCTFWTVNADYQCTGAQRPPPLQ